MLKFIAKCRHRPSVRVNFSINMEFLENKIGEITARESLIAILESVNGVQKIESGALIIVSNYILILIWRKIYIYLFDCHSKDEKGNLSSYDTALLQKSDTLYSLKNYVRSVCYNTFPLT